MAINKLDRAKQFLPFDALKGLKEALHEKEIIYDEKKELAEDAKEDLSSIIQTLMPQDEIIVTYYFQKFYHTAQGIIKKIDYIKKKIILEDETVINIINIISIEII